MGKNMTNTELATWLHDNYQGLTRAFKMETQNIKISFDELPKQDQCIMLALANRMNNNFLIIDRQSDDTSCQTAVSMKEQ